MTSSTNSQQVAEIFLAAGNAFEKLGDLTMELHPNPDAQPNSKWTSAEIDNLRTAIKQFGDNLNDIASRMKMRSVSQVKQKMKEEMMFIASASGKKSAGGSPDAPPAKKARPGAADTSANSVGDIDKDENTSDIKVEMDGGSDVESVTIHDSELHVDDEGQLSSDSDGSDVDV